MTYRLIVEPEAEAELIEAADWYDARSKIVRASFLSAVDAALRRIQDNPYQYQIIFGRARRAMLQGFPYALIYVAAKNEVIVAACVHCSRHPRRWRKRIG
jgi:plasmid stabilization system protein ParE